MNVIFAASGTGGHLVPAIRLARGVRERIDNCRILFIGGKHGLENQMIGAAGFELEQIPVRGFDRRRPWKNIAVLWALRQSIVACRRIIRRFAPDVAVGTGGYAAGPVIRVAHQSGVPTLIQEQNRQPGLTTNLLSRVADIACVAFAETTEKLAHPTRAKTLGNPIDTATLSRNRAAAARDLGLSPEKQTVLVTGGSQGAHSINNNIARHLAQGEFPSERQLLWQTGQRDFELYQRFSSPEKGVIVKSFIEDLSGAMAACDLVIARAGALTIAEITARGLPSILVPYPFAAADHQSANAKALAEAGAGEMVADSELDHHDLLQMAGKILTDSGRVTKMAAQAKSLGRPDATERIVDEIISLARRGKGLDG